MVSTSADDLAPRPAPEAPDPVPLVGRAPLRLVVRRGTQILGSVPLSAGLRRACADGGAAGQGTAVEVAVVAWHLCAGTVRGPVTTARSYRSAGGRPTSPRTSSGRRRSTGSSWRRAAAGPARRIRPRPAAGRGELHDLTLSSSYGGWRDDARRSSWRRPSRSRSATTPAGCSRSTGRPRSASTPPGARAVQHRLLRLHRRRAARQPRAGRVHASRSRGSSTTTSPDCARPGQAAAGVQAVPVLAGREQLGQGATSGTWPASTRDLRPTTSRRRWSPCCG